VLKEGQESDDELALIDGTGSLMTGRVLVLTGVLLTGNIVVTVRLMQIRFRLVRPEIWSIMVENGGLWWVTGLEWVRRP